MRLLKRIASCIVGIILVATFFLPFANPVQAGDVKVDEVPIDKQATDTSLLKAFAQIGLSKEYVELGKDYSKDNPYSQTWSSKTTTDKFLIVSQLPHVNADGTKVDPQWYFQKAGEYISGQDVFITEVKANVITITCLNDQAWGAKGGQVLSFSPQLFLNGKEIKPISTPVLLPIDPLNSNYTNNTLVWDYRIAKRYVRLIEGMFLGRWEFASKPAGTIDIKYNQIGEFKLKLGEFAVSGDEEVVTPAGFDLLVLDQKSYPVTVYDSATFYPDATAVDGYTREDYAVNSGKTWAAIISNPGTSSEFAATNTPTVVITADGAGHTNNWTELRRSIYMFPISLPAGAVISAAAESIRGSTTYNVDGLGLGANGTIAIYASTPTNTDKLVNGDYTQVSTTQYSTNTITWTAWNTTGYNVFTLNAAAIAAIPLSGVFKTGVRDVKYDVGNVQPPWVAFSYPVGFTGFGSYFSPQGVGYKPTLVITYTTGTIPSVTTGSTTNITDVTATASGNITNVGTNATEDTIRGVQVLEDNFPNASISFNSTYYDAFGILAQTDSDTVMYFYRQGTTHASDKGKIVKRSYTISTNVWSAASDVYVDATWDVRNVGGGIINNQVYLSMMRYDWVNGWGVDPRDCGYIKSTDLTCSSWSGYTVLPTTLAGASPYGHIVSTNTPGTYLMPFYESDAGAINNKVGAWKTTDYGANWTSGATIYSGSTPYTETCIDYIGSNKMIALLRSDAGGHVYQSVSSDNGETWSSINATNLGSANKAYNSWIIYDSTSSDVIASFRDLSDYSLQIAESDADTVFNDSTKWNAPMYIKSIPSLNPGYMSIVKISNTKYFEVCFWETALPPSNYTDTYQYIYGRAFSEVGSFGTGNFTANLTDLSPVTFYYTRAFASNIYGYGYGVSANFTTVAGITTPTLTTANALSVEETTATGSGNVTAINDTNIAIRGFVWDTSSHGDPGDTAPYLSAYSNNVTESDGWGTGTFTLPITGLAEGALYYMRACAKNDVNKWGYGAEVTFLTKPLEPTAFTATAGNATVFLDWTKGTGADNTTIRGKIGSYPADQFSDTLVYNGIGISANHTGLTAGDHWYYRAWSEAIDGGLTQWSDAYDEADATPHGAPIITSFMVEGTGRDWAVLRGYVSNSYGSPVSAVLVETGLVSGVYTANTTVNGTWSTGNYFTLTARNLQPGTVYYWRAGGAILGIWGYGAELPLATEGSPSLREYWNTGGDNSSSNISGSSWKAEQFTTTALGHTATSIRLNLQRYGNPGYVTASLRHATAGVPTGLDLVSGTFNANTLSTSDWLWAEFLITDTSLDGGAQYAIVLRSLSGDSTNFVRWRMDTGGDGSALTVADNSTDGGLSWSSETPADYLFGIWGNEALEVKGGAVFSSYIETGDILFTADMNNIYSPYYPADDSGAYFDLRIYDTDGTTVIASTPCVDWGRRAGSLYLSADAATPLAWGSGYYIKLVGSFDPTNVIASYQLVPADWFGSDLNYLDRWVIREARLMEIANGITYTTSVRGKEALNDAGGVEMDKGISGLSYVRPDLFQTVVHISTYTPPTFTGAFEGATTWQAQVGATVVATMTSVGALVNVNGKVVLQVLLVMAMISLALFTRSFFFGLVLALPIALWGTWMRVIPIQIVSLIGAVAALIVVYKWWFSRG